jgi:hypothetical protein
VKEAMIDIRRIITVALRDMFTLVPLLDWMSKDYKETRFRSCDFRTLKKDSLPTPLLNILM